MSNDQPDSHWTLDIGHWSFIPTRPDPGGAPMIPRRVRLGGFLCYKDEQEIAFDGSALWMLAGLNGSGKSTIFDAVTYALFGHHRGGATNAGELINKDSKALSVEF